MRRRPAVIAALVALAALAALVGLGGASSGAAAASGTAVRPLVSDWQYLGNSGTPPSQAACNAVGRRCFSPGAMANSYNYAALHASGNQGQGKTIAVVDSFGATTIRQDLATFNTAFGLPHLCGESGPSDPSANCPASTSGPRFDIVCVQGCPTPKPPPPNNGTGQEIKNLWDLEVALDVEWAHATAPLANIMLVTTATAETLGVQGLQQMMSAEDNLIKNHQVDVISQSFGTGEGAFHDGLAALNQLRQAFIGAKANTVSVFASSGDGGTSNIIKEPVKNPALIPYPSVGWPASDPLVTAVGGTYLCTNAVTGASVDSVSPPSQCQSHPGVREVGWIGSGGGYSIFFPRPDYQNVLPPGSTFVGSSVGAPGPNSNMRGIPDIAYQASSRTGVLVYLTEPDTTSSGVGCGGANPCSTGWYVVGGTSTSSPQWAGIAAMADQIAGRDLGFLNPALYSVADNPAKYAADFYDVTTGNNQTTSIPGYSASTGWDAVTGLGTPNVANLIPDLIAATP
jgi:subtilase family serine protease